MTEQERDAPDEDALWRAIVDNYGDRPEVPDPPAGPVVPAGSEPEPHSAAEAWWSPEDDDGFVPPDPPPARLPQGPRLAAWVGVFGAPLLLMAVTALQIWVPGLVVFLLVAGFVAGFGYLVATMPRGPRDPSDDGAQV